VTGTLAGRTIVVTRPAHQSAGIVRRLEALGARVVEFPAIRIEPIELGEACTLPVPDDYDWVIYTSANAVLHAGNRLPKPVRARVAAIGPATARALGNAGIPVIAQPRDAADSEGLLALPAFAAPGGLRILILRGAGGRELLHRELARRGASVEVAELYRRVPATPTPAALEALEHALSAAQPPIIAVTSVDVLTALVDAVPAHLRGRLAAASLLVPGPRIAAAARDLTWLGSLIEVPSAEDAAMVEALVAALCLAGSSRGA